MGCFAVRDRTQINQIIKRLRYISAFAFDFEDAFFYNLRPKITQPQIKL